MPSQFEQVMKYLATQSQDLKDIQAIMVRVENKLDRVIKAEGFGGVDELFGEDPFDERDYTQEEFRTAYEHGQALPDESGMDSDILPTTQVEEDVEVLSPRLPGVTRRKAEVRGIDGKTKLVNIEDLDPRIQKVLLASVKAGSLWFLYERESDGQIMISADDRVINAVSRGEVPESDNEPDLIDQPEES